MEEGIGVKSEVVRGKRKRIEGESGGGNKCEFEVVDGERERRKTRKKKGNTFLWQTLERFTFFFHLPTP